MTLPALPMDRQAIEAWVPHRRPMLLVDRVLAVDLDAGTVIAQHDVAEGNFYFGGHFPGHPIMPGVMVVESMAQTAAVAVNISRQKTDKETVFYFMQIERARFRHPVLPGCILEMRVQRLRHKAGVYVFKGQAVVGETVVAECEFTAKVVEKTV